MTGQPSGLKVGHESHLSDRSPSATRSGSGKTHPNRTGSRNATGDSAHSLQRAGEGRVPGHFQDFHGISAVRPELSP